MLTEDRVLDPAILDVAATEDRVELRFSVPDDLFYLRGHFPGFPVLPGVVQLDWAIHYGRQYFPIGDGPAKTVQIKFRKLIHPNAAILLELTYLRERQRLSFEIRDEEGIFSSGRIGFAEP